MPGSRSETRRSRTCGGQSRLSLERKSNRIPPDRRRRGSWHNGGVMTSTWRALGKAFEPVHRRLARVDLREHEDKILLLLALVISAVVGLIVVAFVAVTERMGRVLVNAGAMQRVLSPLLGSLVGGWLLFKYF